MRVPFGTAALVLVLSVAACGGDDRAATETGAADAHRSDVAVLADHVERIHPDPWHAVSREAFRAAADELERDWAGLGEDERLVRLMGLLALLGERDGHSGVFPLDPAHGRELHLYPLRLYDFADGLAVVDAPGRPGLVGARLEAIAGLPVREALERVTPLVPHDNPWSLAARAPQYLLVAEVLHGLGLTDAAGTAEFDLVRPDGRRMTATLEPIPADAYRAAQPDLFHPMVPPGLPRRPAPPALARRLEERWTATLAGGEVLYVAYNVTLGSTSDLARGLRRLARRPHVERIVLDLRHNPGGNNTTYGPLLHELERVDGLVVLVGRTTFSAAANLLAELEAGADPLLVGEPTGGSPNLYGDPVPVTLPESGLTAHVAGVAWAPAGPDERLAFEPDVRVELTTMDFLAGRDPALSAALRPAPR